MELKEIQLNIPENWNSVTISQFIELNNIDKDLMDNKYEFFIQQLAILCNADPDVIAKIPMNELNGIINILQNFNEETLNKEYQKKFKLDGVSYGIIPDMNKLSLGEWIDLEEFSKDIINNIHIILAILYRPIIKSNILIPYQIESYDSDNLNDRAKLFKDNLTIDKVYSAAVFFCLIGKEFINPLKTYSESLMNKMMNQTYMVLKAQMNEENV
jgi:hypothetical protein